MLVMLVIGKWIIWFWCEWSGGEDEVLVLGVILKYLNDV